MSAENIQAFLTKVESDEALKKEVTEIAALPAEEARIAIEALAAKLGTPFTAAELAASGSELSEAALEQVAGGSIGPINDLFTRYILPKIAPSLFNLPMGPGPVINTAGPQ